MNEENDHMEQFLKLREILYKPIKVSGSSGIFIVYQLNYSQSEMLNTDFEEIAVSKITLSILDVQATILSRMAVYDFRVVDDISTFLQSIEEVDNSKIKNIFNDLIHILRDQIIGVSEQVVNLQGIMSSILFSSSDDQLKNNEQLIVANEDLHRFISIAMENHTKTDKRKLQNHEYDTIIGVIQDILANYSMNIDLDDKEAVKKIKDEIELGIIDKIPDDYSISDLDIDMEGLLSELKKNQENDENDDENFEI